MNIYKYAIIENCVIYLAITVISVAGFYFLDTAKGLFSLILLFFTNNVRTKK